MHSIDELYPTIQQLFWFLFGFEPGAFSFMGGSRTETRPKKKAKAKAGSTPSAPKVAAPQKQVTLGHGPQESQAQPDVNTEYLQEVALAVMTIQSKWPGIETADPLPVADREGRLAGFIAPYDPDCVR